jgi:hypothetical protein
MCGVWRGREFDLADKGALTFSQEQGASIREAIRSSSL